MTAAVLTGSQRYGVPRAGMRPSDIDLAILVSAEEMCILARLSGEPVELGKEIPHFRSMRFGPVNLLVSNAETPCGRAYHRTWMEGTAELVARRPVTRTQAIAVFQKLRKEAELGEMYAKEEEP